MFWNLQGCLSGHTLNSKLLFSIFSPEQHGELRTFRAGAFIFVNTLEVDITLIRRPINTQHEGCSFVSKHSKQLKWFSNVRINTINGKETCKYVVIHTLCHTCLYLHLWEWNCTCDNGLVSCTHTHRFGNLAIAANAEFCTSTHGKEISSYTHKQTRPWTGTRTHDLYSHYKIDGKYTESLGDLPCGSWTWCIWH